MSSFRKPLLVMACLVLLIGTSSVMAQRSELYNGWQTDFQTRNIPAGTIHDPGSQLLYLVDTGVNARAAANHTDLEDWTSPLAVSNQPDGRVNPFGVGGPQSIYELDGDDKAQLQDSRINQSFITITNTHPTQAVTIHFRYFNDECIDVLDFLVVLTCNDTLIFDPFNYDIPFSGVNTRTRIFGPAKGVFGPIPASQFASGRFLIFATAAGTSYEPNNASTQDDNAELRFPAEFDAALSGVEDHCDNLADSTYFGIAAGLRANNLHVFNSSAVSFNYLIGTWANSQPADAEGVVTYALEALVRPAIDLTEEIGGGGQWSLRLEGDGDGPPLLDGNDFRILTGNEQVKAANQQSNVQTNSLYLAQRAHGGDTAHIDDVNNDTILDYDSWWGALAFPSIFGLDFADQLMHFLSVVDDYNGSRHSNDDAVAGLRDRSYNLNGAHTTYVLQIYNNDERLFDLEGTPPINVSPPPPQPPIAELKIVVDCLRVWVTTDQRPETEVDDLTIEDLDIISAQIGIFLANREDPNDLSHGWIRFVRDNTEWGTYAIADLVNDSTETESFVTQAVGVLRAGGRGGAHWLFSAASDPLVSSQGDPQCNGLCITKNNLP